MSSSSANTSPNPKPSMITPPSTSNPPENPEEKETQQQQQQEENVESEEPRNPNWLELPEDVWFMILSKLRMIDIIENAQKVCMLFRKLCKQPAMFKTIDMSFPDAYMDLPYDVNKMTRFAVDRSAGVSLDISLGQLCDDDTLMYIVDRSKNLKRLVLQNYVNVSDEGLIEAVSKLPMLEDLQLIICEFSDETVEAVGHACPTLKSFSFTQIGSRSSEFSEFGNDVARAIARSMPQLCHLQLIGSDMTNEGLKAILDACQLLECLDLRACFQINLSGDLGKRCERIKRVRYPNDSTEDYGWQAFEHGYDESRDQEDSDYDSDDDYDDHDDYMFGLDMFDFADFEDEYDDFSTEDDDYRLYCDYVHGGGFPGYESLD